MKIRIHLKDPDGVYESIERAAKESAKALQLGGKELEEIVEYRRSKLKSDCRPWIKFDECVTVEIDTEAGTASVCKANVPVSDDEGDPKL